MANDKSYAKEKKAAVLLNRVLSAEPDHPGVAHYLIHRYDYPQLARLALPAARRYAQIAPASAHARHMPSHIFTRLGLWREAIRSNLDAAAAANAHAARNHMAGAWDEQLPSLFPWNRFRWAEAHIHFARAVGAARRAERFVIDPIAPDPNLNRQKIF